MHLSALLLLTSCAAAGQGAAPLGPAPEADALELRPVLGRESFEVGEPVILLVGLVNGGAPRRLPPPDVEYLRIEVQRPGGEGWERFDTGRRRVARRVLPTGGIDVAAFDLHLRDGRWWLTEPGRYRIRVAYTDAPYAKEARWLTRTELGFTVRSAERSRVAAVMTDPALTRFLARPDAAALEKARAQVETALRTPGAAAYVHAAMGAYRASARYDPETNAFRADHEAAREHFRAALSADEADPITRARALRHLIGSLRATDSHERVERVLAEYLPLWEDHPQREVVVRWIRGDGSEEKE